MSDPESIQSIQLKYGDAPQAEVEDNGFWYDMNISDLEKIAKWIGDTDPDSVRNAGVHYSAAERLLEGILEDLAKKRIEVAENFKGPVSVFVQDQLKALDANIQELGNKLGQLGGPLKDYADTLDWAKENVVDSRYRHSKADQGFEKSDFVPFFGIRWSEERARNILEKVNERIVEHYERLPAEVRWSMAMPTQVEMPTPRMPNFPNLSDANLPNGLDTSGVGDMKVPPYDLDQFGRGPSSLNAGGLNTDGLNTDGLNAGGLNTDGLNAGGLNADGLNEGGLNTDGLNAGGLNTGGLNTGGLNTDGLGLNGSDLEGVNTSLPNPNLSLPTPNMPNASAANLSLPGSGMTRLAGLDNALMIGLPGTFGSGNSRSGLSGPGPGPGAGTGSGSGGGGGFGSGTGFGSGGSGGGGGSGTLAAGGAAQQAALHAGARAGMNGISMPPSMMPPGSAADGRDEQQLENESWLLEDDDVWGDGGPTTDATLA